MEIPDLSVEQNLSILPTIKDAYIIVEDDVIAEIGKRKICSFSKEIIQFRHIPLYCLAGAIAIRTLFLLEAAKKNLSIKSKGLSYAEIAAKGGGILNSAKKLNEASEDVLFTEAWKRLEEISRLGTGAIEIKSGYGLSLEGELKMLRVIKKLKEKSTIKIKATFLGAHTFPLEYKEDHQGYIDLIINEMLPVIAKENLADYIDVFCEEGFFSPKEMMQICEAGKKVWIKTKITRESIEQYWWH